MSKEAAQRAMREARYAERMANGSTGIPATRTRPPVAPPAGSPAATPRPAAKSPATAPAATTTADTADTAAAGDGLCGHKSMNGRTCTREHGHAAKSHRYS